MADLFEAARDAFNSLWGLKRASVDGRAGAQPQMIGSDPGREDDNRYLLNAAAEYYRYYTHLEPDRVSIYSDIDEMYQYVLAHAAMEAYIEDALQEDMTTGLSIFPQSPSPQVQAELLRLFENLELEDRAPGDLWGLGKYGDHFTVLRYEKKVGVYDALPMEPRICHRHENSNRVLQGFTVGDQGDFEAANKTGAPNFKPWDLVHWRIRGKRPTDPYGTPFFIQVRLIYKVLKLMEEQMTIYRMNMHPDRLLFKVFTGSAGPDERRRIVRMWRRELEKVASFNHASGRFTSEYSPWFVNQNMYWPVGQNDQVSGVEKFPGSANCFAGDTQIPLLDGRTVSIKDVQPGDWVYSCEAATGRIKPGHVIRSFKSGENQKLVRVTLDDGSSFRVTPSHKFMLRTGEKVEAQTLVDGSSLMPLYRGEDRGYVTLRQNDDGTKQYAHRMVMEGLLGRSLIAGEEVHHDDETRCNNTPSNLVVTNKSDHIKEHWAREHYRKAVTAKLSDPAFLQGSSERLIEYNKSPAHKDVVARLHEQGRIGLEQDWVQAKIWTETSRKAQAVRMGDYNRSEHHRETMRTLHAEGKSGFSNPDILTKIHTQANEEKRKAGSRQYLHDRWHTKRGVVKAECAMCQATLQHNHKVVSVEWCQEQEDVYNVTVEGYHNLAIGDKGNIFVYQSGDIFDVEYMRDLFFAGVRIPKAYLGFEDSQGYRGTDTLSAQSIKFARGVKRLQRHFLQGLTRLCRIHLALKGMDSHQPQYSFTLKATPVSYLDEAHKAELYAKRYEALNYMLDIGDKMSTSFGEGKFNAQLWMQYVLREFGHFDDDMIMKLTSPSGGGSADVTYMPAGTAFRFESLDEDMRKRIHEAVMKDDDLRRMLTNDLGLADLSFHAAVTSFSDRQSLSLEKIPERNDSTLFEKAASATIAKRDMLGKEAKERLAKELYDLAEHMQKRFTTE